MFSGSVPKYCFAIRVSVACKTVSSLVDALVRLVSLLPPTWLRSPGLIAHPAVRGTLDDVKPRDVRLDVQQGRPVKNVKTGNHKRVGLPTRQSNDGHADPVRAAGMS